MGEGFLPAPGGDGSMKEEYDVGVSYYTSLIRRNLIQPVVLDYSGSETVVAVLDYSGSQIALMDGVIRSFAEFMAKEEVLVIRPGQESTQLISSAKFRRLSIVSTKSESAVVLPDWNSISEKQELLRSLIIKGRMKFEPGIDSSLNRFPSLPVLMLRYAESDRFVESLAKLKHLRFLLLSCTDISRLPDDIHKMKFLEYVHIEDCARFSGELPNSIVKLERLRHLLIIDGAPFTVVPKGFGGLTNLRELGSFPVQTDGEWCSLQELGSLYRLRNLKIVGLQAAMPCSASSSATAAKAKMHEKQQLKELYLDWNNPREEENRDEVVQRVEEVIDQLRPPCHVEELYFDNYLGRRGPSWLTAAATVDLKSLTRLRLRGLPFCTQLPDGLCQLHSLKELLIRSAPAIRRVGPEFVHHHQMSAFPRLEDLKFSRLPNWEEWKLHIQDCSKLDRLPAGLASSKRIAPRELSVHHAARITALENIASVETLTVYDCPRLKVIRGFPRLRYVGIELCRAIEVLQEVGPALDSMELIDPAMKTLPEYLRGLQIGQLFLRCPQRLHDLLNSDSSNDDEYWHEMEKIKHCGYFLTEPADQSITTSTRSSSIRNSHCSSFPRCALRSLLAAI
ncbi:hypothetical protein EJB05_50432, partial [Eragrostis curvula]